MMLVFKHAVAAIFLALLSSASAQTPDDKNCGNDPIFRCDNYWLRAAKDVEKMDFAELQTLKPILSACESFIVEDKILLHYCSMALDNYYIEYSAKKRSIDALLAAVIGEIQNLRSQIRFDETITNQSAEMRVKSTAEKTTMAIYMTGINRALAEAVSARFQELRSAK